jgi:LSD1 subclass zinc finger protein
VKLLIRVSIVILAFALIAEGGQRRSRKPVQRTAGSAAIDYSSFSHATKKHQEACSTCHKVPTDNWKQIGDYPDVADYPDHDACVSCHRPQFFKGAKPVICSVCHAKVSPRDETRFAFRNPAVARQFTIEFPHDKHQDVIARLFRRFSTVERSGFVRVSFRGSSPGPHDKTKHYNNCEICHQPRASAPLSNSQNANVPDAAAFKAVPASHASCFNCHWKSQQPTSDNCAGCHKLAAKPYLPVDQWPGRISFRFRHAREQHVAECTTCHINITKAATLRGLKPDVPITSCTECHNKDGLRLDVSKELAAVDKDRDFECSYCHASEIGRRDPPASHYLIAGREPLKRKDIK